MLAHLGAMFAYLEGNVGPSWGLCCPILRLCWPILRPMLAHVDPSSATNSEKLKHGDAKNTIKRRGFWRHGVPPWWSGENAYGKDTASPGPGGSLAGFKRLRATAGQGPNYVGPSCGYVGLSCGQCGPSLGLCWPSLGL